MKLVLRKAFVHRGISRSAIACQDYFRLESSMSFKTASGIRLDGSRYEALRSRSFILNSDISRVGDSETSEVVTE